MKRLTILVVLVALAWSGYWAYAATTLQSGIRDWFEARRAEGWQADHAQMRVRGFPNRVDLRFEDLTLADPEAGLRWQAPQFQILQLTYKPRHKILAFPDDQTIETPSGPVDVTSDGLLASVVFDGAGQLDRLGLEAAVLNIALPRRSLALAGVKGGMERQEGARYRLGLTADAAAGLAGEAALDALTLRAEIAFDRPFGRDVLVAPRPAPRQIDLQLAEYRQGAVYFSAAGRLAVDSAGRPDGTLQLRAENWRALLADAVQAGHLPRSLAQTIEQALALVAGLSGDPDRLEVPLNFDRGLMRLGPIPLGPAPRLRLP